MFAGHFGAQVEDLPQPFNALSYLMVARYAVQATVVNECLGSALLSWEASVVTKGWFRQQLIATLLSSFLRFNCVTKNDCAPQAGSWHGMGIGKKTNHKVMRDRWSESNSFHALIPRTSKNSRDYRITHRS